MSRMMLRSNAKPPLARSPSRLQSRKPLQPVLSNVIHSSPGSMMKPQMPIPFLDAKVSDLRPEYQAISSEIIALTKMVHQELGNRDSKSRQGTGCPLFERGILYDEYAARRNERLKRKKTEAMGIKEKKPSYDLGVRVESAKKTNRKANPLVAMADKMSPVPQPREVTVPVRETPRYSLRSSTRKENVKPPLLVMMNAEKSSVVKEKKVGGRRSRKI